MREIKFRGKRKDNGEFVYGGIITSEIITAITSYDSDYLSWRYHEVQSESVSQFTGIKDKNGKEVYEGDVLKVPDFYETPENTSTTYHFEKVIFTNYGFGTDSAMFYEDGDYISQECEVVGNIYENPEFLTA